MAPALIPIAMYAGTAIAVYGAVQQGKAQKAAAQFNAAQAKMNAEMARSDALVREQQIHRETLMRIGAARAAQGASGGTAEGSFLDVIGSLAAEGELEAQWARYTGERQAAGYETTASLDQMRGKAASDASYINAASSLASGLARGYSSQRQLNPPRRGA